MLILINTNNYCMSNRVLFVHDGPMYVDSSGNIYGIHYDNKIVDRYAQLGSYVTFLMRQQSLKENFPTTLSKITRDNFSFVAVPNFKSISTYFLNKPKAKKLINEAVLKNDIVVIRMPSASGVMAISAAIKFGKPYLVEMVACTFDAYWYYNWKGKLIAHYKKWKIKRIISVCPYVIYVTKSYLQGIYPTIGKMTNISNVELNTIDVNVLGSRIEKIKNLKSNNSLVLGTVAVVDIEYKGQADVIRALGELKRQGIRICYYLVGQGNPLRLENIIIDEGLQEEVKILGALKHEEVFKFLESIDVYIQPSHTEGLPRALVEAMSLGLPCLGSKVGGIPELLQDSCLFIPSCSAEILQKIKSINIDWMLNNAEINFEKAKEYNNDILDNRRRSFYKEFLESIKR